MLFLRNCCLIFKQFGIYSFQAKRPSSHFSIFLNNSSVQQFLQALSENKTLIKDEGPAVQEFVEQRKLIEKELQLLNDMKEDDREMIELMNEEKQRFLNSIESINEQILLQLLPGGAEDRDVVVEVTAGVGGKESMHFANELFEMYANYCRFNRWDWELQEIDVPGTGGIRHGSAFVSGRGAASSLLQESGVHRVQRVPETEKSGRIHTSTVTVAILPQPTEVEIVIKDKDIKIETKTSSGAGGQHVNRTETCVRITHLPTGIVIENQTDRSQIRNKKIALQRLRSRLYQMELDGYQNKFQTSRKEQVGSSMRSEKIRTYNYNQDRITDHRIGITLHDLPRFLQGGNELHQLIEQLIDHDRSQKLLQLVEDKLRAVQSR